MELNNLIEEIADHNINIVINDIIEDIVDHRNNDEIADNKANISTNITF